MSMNKQGCSTLATIFQNVANGMYSTSDVQFNGSSLDKFLLEFGDGYVNILPKSAVTINSESTDTTTDSSTDTTTDSSTDTTTTDSTSDSTTTA